MRPSRRNHVVITFTEFLPCAKNLACLSTRIGPGKTESGARPGAEVHSFEGLDEAANVVDIRTIKGSHFFLLSFFSREQCGRNSWKGSEARRRLQMLPSPAFILRKFWSEVPFED
jgi:hypothetical protein